MVLQNAALILAGLVLGGRRGFFVGLLFIVLGMLGLPVLAGGNSVLANWPGPTAGYLVGYIVSPAIAGLISYRAPRKNKAAMTGVFLLAAFVGLFVQYFLGAIGLMIRSQLSVGAAAAAQLPFIVPDSVKMVAISLIAVAVHAAFPDLRANAKRPRKARRTVN